VCKFLLVFHCNHVSIMYRLWYSTLCPQNQLRVVQGQWRWHHSIDRIGVPIRLPFWLLPYLVLCTVLVSRYRNNLISIVLFLLLYLCPSYSEVFVKYHDFFHTTFYITSTYNPPSPLGKQVANIIFAAVFYNRARSMAYTCRCKWWCKKVLCSLTVQVHYRQPDRQADRQMEKRSLSNAR